MEQQSSIHEYLAAFRRRKWLFLGSVVLVLAASLVYSYTRVPQYRSTAEVAYQRRAEATAGTGLGSAYVSSLDVDRDIKTAAAVIPGRDMAERAARILGVPSWEDIPGTVTAESVEETNLVRITAVSPDPGDAKAVADAYARAFIEWRTEVVRGQLKDAEAIIVKRLEQFRSVEARESDPGTYYSLSSQLSALRTAEALTNGNYEILQSATFPEAPFTPRHVRNGLLGLAAGIVVGIGLVLLAEQLDVRVREPAELAEALSLPVIGRVPVLPKHALAGGPLVVLDDPDGASAEAFRVVRGNLDFVAVGGEMRSILVTSCTQGEGKTSTVCNLAVTLARSGKKVVVVEADLRRPKVHTYFNVRNDRGLSSVIAGQIALADALHEVAVPVPGMEGVGDGGDDSLKRREQTLYLLTSGILPPNPGEIVSSDRMTSIIGELSAQADVVLVDSPPFLAVGDAAALAAKVDGLLLVMKIGEVTRPMVRDALEFMRPLPCRKLGIVVTNVPLEGGSYRYRYYREKAAEANVAPSAGQA